jgi:hypothetical protein
VRTPRAVLALVCALGCVPHAVPLAPEQRADTASRLRIGGFELAPPAGRWIAERVAAGRVFERAKAPWRAQLASEQFVTQTEALRLCALARVAWEVEGSRPDARERCIALQPFSFVDPALEASSVREAVAQFAPHMRTLEAPLADEPDFWRGVKFIDGRGDAASLRIGANEFVDLHFVAKQQPTRVLRSTGRMLLLLGPRGSHLAVVVADAGLVAPKSEHWTLLASLTPVAP